MGRFSVDTYSELQEERKAVGSVAGELGVGRPEVTSGYSRLTRNFLETNFDLMAIGKKRYHSGFQYKWLIGNKYPETKNRQGLRIYK
jgi:hypothetical protein